jgi:hypothetical protein
MARTHASKLDELIRLSREREEQIGALTEQVAKLTAVVGEQAKQINAMQPTVDRVAEVITFGRIGGVIGRFSVRLAIICLPVLWWMNDKWHLLAQLFKRQP